MVSMEVDLHSPSFKVLRSLPSSSKRARSPESPTDRPSKRLSLAINHPGVQWQIRHSHPSQNATPASSVCSSRFPSEDWVHQTDGLTIDSPVMPGSMMSELKDEDMNMDPDEPSAAVIHRPDLPPIQTTALLTQQQQQLYQHRFRSSGRSLSTAHSASASPSAPASALIVRVLPPTPATLLPPPTPYFHAPPTRPSTPVVDGSDGVTGSNSSAMLLSSPVASFSYTATSPRRQRFTMGPRADCPKCQLGVKGHSVHY